MRISKDAMCMDLAHVVRQRATCSRLSVGCVLTDDDRKILSIGYNGGPKGGRNGCARKTPGLCGCVHAEMNAIALAPKGLTIAYCTTIPCEVCAVLLINYGIQCVFFDQDYRLPEGRETLRQSGIEIERLSRGAE